MSILKLLLPIDLLKKIVTCLKHHINNKHPEISKYACETCASVFDNLVDMWSHRETEHTDKTPNFQPKSRQEMVYMAFFAEQNF